MLSSFSYAESMLRLFLFLGCFAVRFIGLLPAVFCTIFDQNYLFAFKGLPPRSLNSLAGGITPSHLTLFLVLCLFEIVHSVKLEAGEAQRQVSPQSAREERTIEDRVELTGARTPSRS